MSPRLEKDGELRVVQLGRGLTADTGNLGGMSAYFSCYGLGSVF